MRIIITPNDKGNPPGKLADAELCFDDGPLAGLKLIGFSVWERRGAGGHNVTFPARQYSVNGERRSFALLRPIVDVNAQSAIRQAIIDAYIAQEVTPPTPTAASCDRAPDALDRFEVPPKEATQPRIDF